jgi:putative transposase
VIVRGNNREPVFAADHDYRYYLEKLVDGARKHACSVHAYVLMTNHVHLLLTPTTEMGLGKLIQFLGRYYVQYFNFTYQRTGTLWEGRYRATLIDSEAHLLTCQRYIEMNPVRAGMVTHPREYRWSSYLANAEGRKDDVVESHALYQALGDEQVERRRAYRGLFRNPLPASELLAIREATNKAWVLGNDRFRAKVDALQNRRSAPRPRGGDRRSKAYRGPINRD